VRASVVAEMRRLFDWGEDGCPVVFHADGGPAFRASAVERALGARRVRDLALGVVVEQQ
jgi:hypothetical protein